MISKIRKFLSPIAKEKVLNSMPYRFLSRLRLYEPKIRIGCELTTRCNLECDICSRSNLVKNGGLYVGDMDEYLIKRVIQEIKKLYSCGRHICFMPMGLGDPLLYKGLFDLFQNIKDISREIRIVLVTNGILLDETCCKQIVSSGIDEVSISLNANNSLNYHQHMKVGMYDKVCNNVENLIRLRNKSGFNFPDVFVQYINYDNDKSLFKNDIKNWLKIMNYNDKCYVHPIVNQAGFFKKGNSLKHSEEKYPCSQPHSIVAIKINGDIYPCCSCFYSGSKKVDPLYLGNIMTADLTHIFGCKNSNKRLKIIKSMRKDDYSQLPECKKCDAYKLDCNCYFKLPRFLRIYGYRWL